MAPQATVSSPHLWREKKRSFDTESEPDDSWDADDANATVVGNPFRRIFEDSDGEKSQEEEVRMANDDNKPTGTIPKTQQTQQQQQQQTGGAGANTPTTPIQQLPGDPNDAARVSNAVWNAMVGQLRAAQQTSADLSAQLAAYGNRAPVVSQEAKLPNYEGFTDSRPAEVWFARAENVAAQYGWSDLRFIEAATGALTKGAEAWLRNLQFQAQVGSRTLKDKAEFKKAFLKQFDVSKSVAGQTKSLASLKQEKDEKVQTFYVRVSNTLNELVEEYAADSGWAPDADANGGIGNDDARRLRTVYNFVEKKLKTMYLVNGMHSNIADIVRPRLRELQRAGKSVLDAAVEAEVSVSSSRPGAGGGAAASALASIDWGDTTEDVRETIIAAFHARGGGRGGRGGGRGGGGRGGFGGGGRGGAGGGKQLNLRAIQSRQRPRYCQNCRQWGRHKVNECRHTASEISAMAAEDPLARPDPCDLVDKCYDGKDEIPTGAGN